MLTANQYNDETRAGVKWQGSNTSTQVAYWTLAVGTQGATAVSLFAPWTSRTTTGVNPTLGTTSTTTGVALNTTTAPTAGTVTGFWLSNAAAAGGTITLWGTTSGTIATIPMAGTLAGYIGAVQGTSVLNAAIAAGDTVYVKGIGSGTFTAYVTFQTAY